ncbi:cilium assembly protein DZIP1L isoform X5 [Ovis aries]|uniref:cilium assembly protein DZIP1L isoform X5 n=1 Tax=Ovis aries TaxID=9940 RepID=UPI00100F1802|nr:cilium assembly protein DZIP1L isoform X5 [Ovis aries]
MALSQLLCLWPWPWWHPSPVACPGLPPPMQSPTPTAQGLSSPLFGAYTLPTFKFQPRRESVDWRRISALDVDRVARELDVATLQENIAGVTFCNLDREVCGRCGQPVDPVLLKVLRLAQLSIEYLLHCQDCLSTSVAQLEARLQASLGQQERGQQELGRQADELKGVREESRRRRKMISALQQLLLQTGAHSYHTCHLCDKTFMNATFLRGHIQRRHAGVVEGGKQRKQEQPVEEVLEELRAKLKWTQGELEAQRQAERQRQLQEAEIIRQREAEAKKEFDEWKEKERAKLYGEIDKLKKLFWDEFTSVANQNSTLEEKLQALQSHNMMKSNLGSLRDEEPEERLRQAQELWALKEKMEIQKTEWRRKMKALQEEHAAQKREMQAMSLQKVEGICEGPKAVDTDEDSSEEELEDSHSGQQKVLEALRRNPTLLKQFRPVLEDTLEEKLESMGIKRDAKGIPAQTLRHLESILRAQREQKARRFSEFLSLREKLIKEATSRVKDRQKDRAPMSQPEGEVPGRPNLSSLCKGSFQSVVHISLGATLKAHGNDYLVKSQQSPLVTKEVQPKARTLHVAQPSKPAEPAVTSFQSRSSHSLGLAPGPTPTPRSRAPGPSGTPSSPGPGLSTPPFSSEEDSERDAGPRASLQPLRALSRVGPRPQDDSDWSDTETSEGSAQAPGKGSGGLASSGTLVQSMVRNLEKQLEAPAKKPAGGVSLFSVPSAGPQRAAVPGGKPQLSEDESDLEISSLEDLPQDLNQREKPKPLSRSKLPEKFGASSWSPSQPRVPGW